MYTTIGEYTKVLESRLKENNYPTLFDKECDQAELRVLKSLLEIKTHMLVSG
jgi:hypothetical protein